MAGQTCNGCVGRGTGGNCGVCSLPIPADLRLTKDSPREFNPVGCRDCRQGRRHSHVNPGGA